MHEREMGAGEGLSELPRSRGLATALGRAAPASSDRALPGLHPPGGPPLLRRPVLGSFFIQSLESNSGLFE
jgi:hypothetical protein